MSVLVRTFLRNYVSIRFIATYHIISFSNSVAGDHPGAPFRVHTIFRTYLRCVQPQNKCFYLLPIYTHRESGLRKMPSTGETCPWHLLCLPCAIALFGIATIKPSILSGLPQSTHCVWGQWRGHCLEDVRCTHMVVSRDAIAKRGNNQCVCVRVCVCIWNGIHLLPSASHVVFYTRMHWASIGMGPFITRCRAGVRDEVP